MEENLYPYLILLPNDPKSQKKILSTIFGSDIAQSLIINIASGVEFQKDLIKKLTFSNKTIINYLRDLVDLNILEENSTTVGGYRRLFYKLTKMGEWFSSLVVYRDYKPEEFKGILEELFQMYLKHAIGLLLENKFKQDKIRDIFESTLSSHLKEEYIKKLTIEKYIEDIQSLNNELDSILSSIDSFSKEKKKELLKINELKELDEFYGILKNKFQKLSEKLKNF